MNQTKRSLSSSRGNKRFNKTNDYGETLFKVLFIINLILGVLVSLSALIIEDYFSLLLSIGLSTILFSFVFRFMENVISLLKEIKSK